MKFTAVAVAAILGITGSEAIFHGTLSAGDILDVGTPQAPSKQQTLVLFDEDHEIVYSCAIKALEFCNFDTGCTCELVQQNNVPEGKTPFSFGVNVHTDQAGCVDVDFQGNLGTQKLSCCGAFPCSFRNLAQ